MQQFTRKCVPLYIKDFKSERRFILDEIKRLEIGKILGKTFTLYKTGFRQFMGLSALSVILIACTTAFGLAVTSSYLLALPVLALMVAAIYINLRMNVSIYKLARSLTEGSGMTVKEAYRSSKGLAGTYFAVVLMYFFITVLPLLGVAVSYTLVENLVLKCTLIALFGIPLAFLYTRYYLAVASALLSERMNGEFQSSKKLVKGDFWRVLIVIILTYGIFMLIGQIISMWTGPVHTGFWPAIIGALIQCAIQVLATPVGIISAVLMYLDLNEIKKVDLLPGGISLSGQSEQKEETDIQI